MGEEGCRKTGKRGGQERGESWMSKIFLKEGEGKKRSK